MLGILFMFLQGTSQKSDVKKVEKTEGKKVSQSVETAAGRLKREKAECPLYYALTDDYVGKDAVAIF